MALILPQRGFLNRAGGDTLAARHPNWPIPQPYEQILNLATTDGWSCVYDFSNPTTWTLRDAGGGNLYYSSIADGLGNFLPMTQATNADQPLQSTIGSFKYAEFGSATRAISRATQTHPDLRTLLLVFDCDREGLNHIVTNAAGSDHFATGQNQNSYLLSNGSTNTPSSSANTRPTVPHVASAIYNSGTNGYKARANGTQVLQGTVAPLAITGLRLGPQGDGGRVGLVMVHPSALTGTSDALSRMETLVKSLYGF